MKERYLSKTPFLTFVYISKCNINLPGYFGNSKKRFLWTGLMDTQLWMDTHKEEHFCANFDTYIEDGELVLPVKIFCWVGLSEGVARPIEDKQIFFRVERTDSFSLDSKQNLVWKTSLTNFKYNHKVTHTRKLKRVTPNSTSLGWQCLLMWTRSNGTQTVKL